MHFIEAITPCSHFCKFRDLGAHRPYLRRPCLSVKSLLGFRSWNSQCPPSSGLHLCFDCHVSIPFPLVQLAGSHATLTPCKRSAPLWCLPQSPGPSPRPLGLHWITVDSLSPPYLPTGRSRSCSFTSQPQAQACRVWALKTGEWQNPCNATGAASPTKLHRSTSTHIWAIAELEWVASCKNFAFLHILSDGKTSTANWGQSMGRKPGGVHDIGPTPRSPPQQPHYWAAFLGKASSFQGNPKKESCLWSPKTLKAFIAWSRLWGAPMSSKKKPLGRGMQDTGKHQSQTRQLPTSPMARSAAEFRRGGCLSQKEQISKLPMVIKCSQKLGHKTSSCFVYWKRNKKQLQLGRKDADIWN